MKRFIEEWGLTIWLVFCLVCIGWIAFHPYPPVIAAPAIKQQEAGCTQFAKVGMWDVYHCVDENGNEFEANSAGMMIPAGN